jgi:hypothetical protein
MPADLDEAWDRWILRQKRMVYEPGRVTTNTTIHLRDQLVLYPGMSGVPLEKDVHLRIELRDLITRQDEPWIPTAAKSKATSLKILAAGRGEAFKAVVGSFCRFFDALTDRAKPRTLADLLTAAERRLDALEREITAGRPPPG